MCPHCYFCLLLLRLKKYYSHILYIAVKYYTIGQVSRDIRTQAVLYCSTSLSWLRCTLCVDVTVLNHNINQLVCALHVGPLENRIDVYLNVYKLIQLSWLLASLESCFAHYY